ncbi:hypothetical protein BG004_000436, partial [Podila humilis]
PLDLHSPYTQSAASKRKSSRSDHNDHISDNTGHGRGYSSDEEQTDRHNVSKKKKKSKREKERRYDYDDQQQNNGYDSDSQQTSTATAPAQKLPPIKLSLKLPPLSSIMTSSSASQQSSHRGFSSGKKKMRTTYDSDDDPMRRSGHEYSDIEQEPETHSHKKKKKHKHKHRHRHPQHEDEEAENYVRNDSHRAQNSLHGHGALGDHDEDMEEGNGANGAGSRRASTASKLKLRLGMSDKEKASKERKLSKKSHRNHPSEDSHRHEPSHHARSPSVKRSPSPLATPSQTHQRSRSQSSSRNRPLSPVETRSDHQWQLPIGQVRATDHVRVGQKRPFAALHDKRSVSQDIGHEQAGVDFDDPLAGDLDEPEDYDEDDDDEEEDGNNGDDQLSDEDDTMSPSTPGTRIEFGSKSLQSGQLGSKTVPRSTAVPENIQTSSVPKEADIIEGSAAASGTTTAAKGKRKGKTVKRLLSPKTTTPAVPKKKELSIVCHKLLDQFIKRDMYVLFTQPVDPALVPDYSSVIKNPMDLSTMRAKVERNFYPTIDEFLSDFQLVCDNARLYNAKDTLYWKQADKLWEWGSKAIERDRKTVIDKDEEVLMAVKDEEPLDIVGMGDLPSIVQHVSRGSIISIDKPIDSPMAAPEISRPHTPQQYRKSKKIKYRRDGTIALSYATDGSIDPASHPDPWSAIPEGPEFGAQPAMTPITRSSADRNSIYLDDYPYSATSEAIYRPSHFQDFGPFALLESPQNGSSASGLEQIPAYTGMVFGDAKGEALVRSLIRFIDPIVEAQHNKDRSDDERDAGIRAVREYVRKKVERLTRGASTIVDKVATIVREEKSGRPSGMDTTIPLTLWKQDFVKGIAADKEEFLNEVVKRESESADVKDVKPSIKKEDDHAMQVDSESQKSDTVLEKSTEKKEPTIDIRQVIQDIKLWPLIQRRRADYLAWRQLKIELDSLLPASQRAVNRTQPSQSSQPLPPSTPSSASEDDDNVKVLWGVKWTGGDTEDAKKWVREYLEKNSAEMVQILKVLSDKITKSAVLSTTAEATPTSATMTPANSTATTATGTTTLASLTDEERTLVETMTKSIRNRLIEMAQYVPLSEINPKNLPPPSTDYSSSNTPTTKPSISESAPTSNNLTTALAVSEASTEPPSPGTKPSTTSTSAADANETSTTTATGTGTNFRPESMEPSEGSISSLSSPGSSP